jgi:hypothetical protein
VNSTTARRPKSRRSILSQIKPRWHEISKFGSLRKTQADSERQSLKIEIHFAEDGFASLDALRLAMAAEAPVF